jgi:hypothetical protein
MTDSGEYYTQKKNMFYRLKMSKIFRGKYQSLEGFESRFPFGNGLLGGLYKGILIIG